MPCQDKTFYLLSQDIVYEEFITLLGSRQNGTEFPADQRGLCNHHVSQKLA